MNKDWIKNNWLSIAGFVVSLSVAWGVLASRVNEVDARTTVLENEMKAYPSKEYFEEKFKNTNDRLDRLDSAFTRHVEKVETLRQ